MGAERKCPECNKRTGTLTNFQGSLMCGKCRQQRVRRQKESERQSAVSEQQTDSMLAGDGAQATSYMQSLIAGTSPTGWYLFYGTIFLLS
jgi:hypothetical protein